MTIYRVQLLEFNGLSIVCINLEVGPVVVGCVEQLPPKFVVLLFPDKLKP